MKSKFEAKVQSSDTSTSELTDVDLNMLHYVAGFVPWKLKQKFSKPGCKNPNREDYLSCLAGMSVSANEESRDMTYLEYTKRWIVVADRSGLFCVSDDVYTFFYEVECLIRKFLHELVHQDIQHSKVEIINEVTTNSGIQFYWSVIEDGLDDDVSQKLLAEGVQLWLTIRGFSIAGAFVEQYKWTAKQTTKKSGLCMELKKRKKAGKTHEIDDVDDDGDDDDANNVHDLVIYNLYCE